MICGSNWRVFLCLSQYKYWNDMCEDFKSTVDETKARKYYLCNCFRRKIKAWCLDSNSHGLNLVKKCEAEFQSITVWDCYTYLFISSCRNNSAGNDTTIINQRKETLKILLRITLKSRYGRYDATLCYGESYWGDETQIQERVYIKYVLCGSERPSHWETAKC